LINIKKYSLEKMSRFGDLLRGNQEPETKVKATPTPKPEVKKVVKHAVKPTEPKNLED
jgi:hypothetical protein